MKNSILRQYFQINDEDDHKRLLELEDLLVEYIFIQLIKELSEENILKLSEYEKPDDLIEGIIERFPFLKLNINRYIKEFLKLVDINNGKKVT